MLTPEYAALPVEQQTDAMIAWMDGQAPCPVNIEFDVENKGAWLRGLSGYLPQPNGTKLEAD